MGIKGLLRDRAYLLELFSIANLAFLAVDIYSAHLVNDFAHWAEWVPFYFSLIAPLFLLPTVWIRNVKGRWSRPAGLLVGGCSILVGVAGLFFHLESQFFTLQTLASLVYTAPFFAPLSYTGIGFLLLLNRMVDHDADEWRVWVILLSMGGFVGNFALSVCDHAQNGFFYWEEWIPVIASAFATSFLFVLATRIRDRGFIRLTLWVMALQALVGLVGFWLHLSANLAADGLRLDDFIYGAPSFAPLLFVDLALLAVIGVLKA